MSNIVRIYPFILGPTAMSYDLMSIISTPALMPSTGTKGKKHVNRFKLSRKLRKKHRKVARNR